MRLSTAVASFAWAAIVMHHISYVIAGLPNKMSKKDKDVLRSFLRGKEELPAEFELFVKYKNRKAKKLARKNAKKVKSNKHLAKLNVMTIQANNATALKKIMKNKQIEYVEPVHNVHAFPLIGDKQTLQGTNQFRHLGESVDYGIEMVQASQLWDIPSVSQIPICVVDSGYGLGHPDLPNVDNNVTGTSSRRLGDWFEDKYGHGTHVAGIIGAIGENDKGTAGIMGDPTRFRFHIGKSLNSRGLGSEFDLINAFESCIDAGSKVISMSLGIEAHSETVEAACKDAYDDGILIIAAAGNDGDSSYNYPATYPSVMSVVAVDKSMKVASFSQYNDQVEIAGPGVNINSTITMNSGLGFGYGTSSGTSMATPYVAGVAALVWSYFPKCSNNQIRNVLIRTAKLNEDYVGCSHELGFGVVQAKDAYELLKKEGCDAGDAGDVSPDPLSDGAIGGCSQDPQYIPPPTTAPTAFSCTDDVFLLELTTDNWGKETSWELRNSKNKVVGAGGGYRPSTAYIEKLCLPSDEYTFTMLDSDNDGMCCNSGNGHYKVFFGGKEIKSGGEFGTSDRVVFGRGPQKRPATPPQASKPTLSPSMLPTNPPTSLPTTSQRKRKPTMTPTASPTSQLTSPPTTLSPSMLPTNPPTSRPTTSQPTKKPTMTPTAPSTSQLTSPPTTLSPSMLPTNPPTSLPTTSQPTRKPTMTPTALPTSQLTSPPTTNPTPQPAVVQTQSPTPQLPLFSTPSPTFQPMIAPTLQPTTCEDDPDWKSEKRDYEDGCEWVERNPKGRCDEIGNNGLGHDTSASTSCRVTCGTCMTGPLTSPQTVCQDDPNWKAERLAYEDGCEWIKLDPMDRCEKIGIDGSGSDTYASTSCRDTCGTCTANTACQDDPSWKAKRLSFVEGCEWVNRNPKDRCGRIGIDGFGSDTYASTSCRDTCRTCMVQTACFDDPNWKAERRTYEDGCEWIKRDPKDRCEKIGIDGSGSDTYASTSCRDTCGTCMANTTCQDDPNWKAKRLTYVEGCQWVNRNPKNRCGRIGMDGSGSNTYARTSCRVACRSCKRI